jgi:cell division protein FtsI/penicillin-binding protein 2
MYNRIRFVSLVLFISFFLLVGRLFYWQILKGKELSSQAQSQYKFSKLFEAPRGNILASDGTWLAARGEAYLVYASLPDVSDINMVADTLSPHFIEFDNGSVKKELIFQEAGRLKELLSNDDLVWIALKHQVKPSVKNIIEDYGINGIGFEYEEARVYPEASSAAHLLGFVGKNEEGENQGYFGLEGYYDLVLSGKPGFLSRDADARGVPILLEDYKQTVTQNGVDLWTYIDKSVQIGIEKKLEKGIEKYGAKAGTVIVMDPKTGGIMGAVSYPSYDPGKYFNFGNEYFINPAVSLSFEPGSIFKVLVIASALDLDAVEPDTKCDICSGAVKVDKYVIETWNQRYRPDSDITDVIVHSDNVGMVFVGRKIGKERLWDYLDDFGIGKETGVDLQGEMSPKFREKEKWSEVDLATASFGQGIAVTPIQMLRAVATIANNGIMLQPKVVEKIASEDWVEGVQKLDGERVISEKTAKEVTAMMVEAARSGEAKWTHLSGFNVAGKTGTAQIPIAGHYDEEKTIASFIGFAPAEDPKFIMLVTLREPESSPWSSETAAPLWYDIAKDLFLYLGIQPEK